MSNPIIVRPDQWDIVTSNGVTMIGIPYSSEGNAPEGPGGFRLEPVFAFVGMFHQSAPAGPGLPPQLSRAYQVLPLYASGSIKGQDIPPGALITHVRDLSEGEKAAISGALAAAIDFVDGMRAQEPGIRPPPKGAGLRLV